MTRFDVMREHCKAKPHGERARYMAGCRCLLCRAANSRYECERSALRKQGLHNGVVSAAKARRHILKLAEQGVGYKQVADAAGVGESIVFAIRSGERTRIRAKTERAILGVDAGARGDGSLVDAGPTQRRIQELIEEGGFSRAEIARRMGKKSPAVQFARGAKVTAKTELAVKRFHAYYLRRES